MPRALLITLALASLTGCPAAPRGPATPAGFQATLSYRVDIGRAMQRQLLTLAAQLHQMLSQPVHLASVEVVERGIWVTPRNEEVRAELRPALVEAVGEAFLVRQTSGKNLMVKRTRKGAARAADALMKATVAAADQRLAAVASGHKVVRHGSWTVLVHLAKSSDARAARQVLGQRGALSLHLVDRGEYGKAARLPFHLMRTGSKVLQRRPVLGGDQVEGAGVTGGGKQRGVTLTLDLSTRGAGRLVQAAESYAGTPLALLLDGRVLAIQPLLDPPPDEGKILTVKLNRRLKPAAVERLSRVLESAVLNGPLPARLVSNR